MKDLFLQNFPTQAILYTREQNIEIFSALRWETRVMGAHGAGVEDIITAVKWVLKRK
jgi:hypothetical protein